MTRKADEANRSHVLGRIVAYVFAGDAERVDAAVARWIRMPGFS